MTIEVGTASTKQNVLILGGTGPTGLHGVRYALDRGHNVTVYARSPEKLPADVISHSNLKVFKGEITPADVDGILSPIIKATNFHFIISYLGANTFPTKETPYLTFFNALLPHLRALPTSRRPYLVVMHTISIIDDERDGWYWFYKMLTLGVRVFGGTVWDELQSLKELWKGEKDVQWCVARVGILNDTGLTRSDGARAGWIAKGGYRIAMSRRDIALWCVLEGERREWKELMPALYAGA